MAKPNVLVEVVSPTLMIAVYGENPPNEQEWAGYLDAMRSLAEPSRVLVCSAGGGPTAMQRSTLEEVIGNRESAAAVVTSSRGVRGIVTALSWFKTGIRAFPPTKIAEAMTYLGATGNEATNALARVTVLARRLEVEKVFGF